MTADKSMLQKKNIFDKLQLSGDELSQLGFAWLVFMLALMPQAFMNGYISSNSSQTSQLIMEAILMGFAIGCALFFMNLVISFLLSISMHRQHLN